MTFKQCFSRSDPVLLEVENTELVQLQSLAPYHHFGVKWFDEKKGGAEHQILNISTETNRQYAVWIILLIKVIFLPL